MKRKRILLGILVTLAALILLIVVYDGKTLPDSRCRHGICIAIHIEEPIPYDQPVQVTATVMTNRDISGLEFGIASPWATIVEGSYEITDDGRGVTEVIDTQAGVPQELTIAMRFTLEGHSIVHAYAVDHTSGAEIEKSLVFYMTTSGGTFDFPDPQPIPLTVIVEATPTPTPPPPYEGGVGRRLPGLKPDEALSECGWSRTLLPPTDWELDGANIWTTIPERVELGEPVEISLGIQVADDQAAGPADLVICAPGTENSPFEILGESAWHLTVQPGDIIQVTTTLRFTQEGWADVRAGAYMPGTGQVMSGGQYTWVTSEQLILSSAWRTMVILEYGPISLGDVVLVEISPPYP